MCRLCLVATKAFGVLPRWQHASTRAVRPARLYSAAAPSSTGANGSSDDTGEPSLATQLAEKDVKIRELSDSYVRLLADMENLRGRTRKEVEAASQFAVAKFSKDIIGVADVMEMALRAVDPAHPLLTGPAAERAEPDNDAPATPEPEGAGSSKLGQLIRGLEMTLEEVRGVLARHGVVPIEPLHQRFDPNLHNALFQVPAAGLEPGIVVSVTKKGYLLHHRVLRAADVGVSRAP